MRRAALATTAALAACILLAALAPGAAWAAFGFKPGAEGFDAAATELNGSPDATAASHPYELTTTIDFNQAESSGQPGAPFPAGDLRDLSIEEPAGLVEDPRALARCSQAEFDIPRSSPFEASLSGESCRADSQVGAVALHTSLGGGETRTFGLFNLVPAPGAPAQLGFAPFGVPIALTPRIRDEGGGFGIDLQARNLTQAFPIDGLTLTIWGTPWARSHDGQRGNCLNETEPSFPRAKCPVGKPALVPPQEYTSEPTPQVYLTLPASCAAPLRYAVWARSWQGEEAQASAASPALGGCEHLSFLTLPSAQLTNPKASSPSGFEFDLSLNQEGLVNPTGTAPPQMKEATVSLPEGVTIDPSMAAGLGVCEPGAYAAASAAAQGCPNAAKIGDFTVRSPLLEAPLQGGIFLAEPHENPFGSLLVVYLIARSPRSGVIVKLAGQLSPDPQTGTITASFEDLPQLPYNHLEVHFREGQRAPLVSPSACGSYTTQIGLHPWLDPEVVFPESSVSRVAEGIGGGPCPAGAPPFAPRAAAGSINSNAGSYSPFYLHLTRTDAEQEITSYSALLPPGLTGKIAGIPRCTDAAIEAAKAMSGTQEAERPSCPAASEIGHTATGYGLGGVLAYAPGKLYLAGPYRGAPLSIVAIDPALVGPFDLGVVVVRSAIRVDPETAQVSVDTAGENPIPHIRDGIPLHLRDIRVYISRPGFTLNPTSCEPSQTVSTLTGSSPPFEDPATATGTAAARYQASNCSSLGFGPRFSLKLRGAPHRGAYPSLRAEVTERPGDANIGRAIVTLPHSEFLAQGHIQNVCGAAQFAASECPEGSIYGYARAYTPLLAEPLEGPVYLRSSPHPLPDLVAALRGDGGIAIDVVGQISSRGGAMRATYEGLPDAPASRFVLTLNGGRKGLLQNSEDLCAHPAAATALLAGQDNGAASLRVPLQAECPKRHGRHLHRKHVRHRR